MYPFAEFLATFLLASVASGAAYLLVRRIAGRGGKKTTAGLDYSLLVRCADGSFFALFVLYAVIFTTLSTLRHLGFNTGGFDVGVFDQAIWNSLNGRLLEVSIVPDAPILLGQRFSPILLMFVPLYAIWNDPIVLLIVQTLALGVAAFPVYWFARERLGYALALAIGASYFLFPALEYVNLYEFHEVALIAPLFSFATYFLLHRRDKAFMMCLGLACLAKEEVAFSVVMFGAFIFFFQRRKRLGLAIALLGMAWGIVVLQYLIPFFRGGAGTGYYYFGHGINAGSGRYDYLGGNLSEIASTVITQPDLVLRQFLIPAKIEYVLHLLVPLAFLPLIGVEISALALPTLGFSLLSVFLFQYSIDSHYAAPLIPLLFFGMVVGLQRIMRWTGRRAVLPSQLASLRGDRLAREWAMIFLVLVSSGVSYYIHAPGPLARQFDPSLYTLDQHKMEGYELMRELPDDSVLVTQKQLAPHLTHRRGIYEFPFVRDFSQVDYLFVDLSHKWYFILKESWDDWLSSGYFEPLKEQDGYLIAKRVSRPAALAIQYGERMTLLNITIPSTGMLRGGQQLRPIVEWRADQEIREQYVIQAHLIDAQGHVWTVDDREPDNGLSPTDQWTTGRRSVYQHILSLPPTMPEGDYQIAIGVHNPRTGLNLSARDMTGQLIDDDPVIATVHIKKDKSNTTASQLRIEQPLYVDMREMRFLGYVPPRETVSPGEVLHLGLYWRARGKPRGDYTVVVQLRDRLDQVAFEHATQPASGTYPTSLWDVGEVLLDWHDFTLPSDVEPGEYTISVALRDSNNNQLLGEVKLSTITVVR